MRGYVRRDVQCFDKGQSYSTVSVFVVVLCIAMSEFEATMRGEQGTVSAWTMLRVIKLLRAAEGGAREREGEEKKREEGSCPCMSALSTECTAPDSCAKARAASGMGGMMACMRQRGEQHERMSVGDRGLVTNQRVDEMVMCTLSTQGAFVGTTCAGAEPSGCRP